MLGVWAYRQLSFVRSGDLDRLHIMHISLFVTVCVTPWCPSRCEASLHLNNLVARVAQ